MFPWVRGEWLELMTEPDFNSYFAWLYPSSLYPHTLAGIVTSYVAGIPFFGRTLASDLTYTAVFFGLHAWLSRTVARSERVARSGRVAPQAA